MNILDTKGYVKEGAFESIENKISKPHSQISGLLSLIADLIRYNTLLSVARAGSGHLGASLSIIELLTEIYFRSFKFTPGNLKSKNRDIFILSKGHAVPSLYATLSAKGYFPIERLNKLRRLGGLAGHADISTPGIEANTGSLAMGLSKAVGFAIAKKRFKLKGNVIVVIGDGELQEGQCWEALLSAASYQLDNLYIIVDDNKVQTDQFSTKIVQYGDIKNALSKLGLAVVKGDGKSASNIHKSLKKLKEIKDMPKLFWCQTIKGQGISFMEHISVLKKDTDRYIWHNKAPNKEQLEVALEEIIERNKKKLKLLNFNLDLKKSLANIPIAPLQTDIKGENLLKGFSDALLKLAPRYKFFVTLDGDLEEDSGYIPFHQKYPSRFFEMGIMEQHMVATAAAFTKLGYTPIISTYAAFLTSRANEQIYNLATEKGKALIIGNMAGVIPATPGKSHQAFRDIACLKNIPSINFYQPITSKDVENILDRYFRGEVGNILYLRLSMAASSRELPSPPTGLKLGQFHMVKQGKDAIIIGIGPVVLGETLKASDILNQHRIDVEIWNHPWITTFDKNQLFHASQRNIPLLIIEDHYIKGGFGESLFSFCMKKSIKFNKITHIALKEFPTTGFRDETLDYLGLSAEKIKDAVKNMLSLSR